MHRRLLNLRQGVPLFALFGLLGCGSGDPVGSTQARVVGGTPTGEDYGGVLFVKVQLDRGVVREGSSSLIAPNLIVTALHVVSAGAQGAFTCDAQGNDISPTHGGNLGSVASAESIQVFLGPRPVGQPAATGVAVIASGSTNVCRSDIAFVVLDRDLSVPTVPLRSPAPVQLGDPLLVVGYGTKVGNVERTQRDEFAVATAQSPRTFTVGTGPCPGDSGGPALTPEGELVGVFSRVSADCESTIPSAVYTDLSYFTPLVEDAFDAAGAKLSWGQQGEGGIVGGAGGADDAPAAAGAGSGGASGSGSAPSRAGGGCALVRSPPSSLPALPWVLLLSASVRKWSRVRQRRGKRLQTRRLA